MQQFGAPAPPGSGASNAGLVLLYAENFTELPAAWPFEQKRLVIGRDAPSDLHINVHAISRVHAELSWEHDGWTLRDLDSTNGTLVDGRRVERARLEPHQEIRLGDAIFKFVSADADSFGRYRIDGVMIEGERLAPGVREAIGGYHMDRIFAEVERIAKSSLSVVLLGESGTGKEVIAREIHRLSGRSGDFKAVNCAAIPHNLLESELFGYKRGAFSGADRDKMGLIRAAHRGTLLLDEIGDMPLEAQAKLLRVLQSKEVYPLGATAPETVDVRIICATHRDLTRLQEEGRFRQDLFARLNEYQLKLPPLRERKEDLYLLFTSFMSRHGRPDLRISFRFMTGLLHYDWPYNVRELEACAKRAIALVDRDVVDADLLPEQIRDEMESYGKPVQPPAPAEGAAGRAATPTEDELRTLLQQHEGNVAAVGRALGKARMQVHRWLQRYGIELDEYRS